VSRNRGASEVLLRVSAPACVGRRPCKSGPPRSRTGLSQDLGRAHSHRSFAELIDERIDIVVRIGALRDSDLVVRKLAANYRIIVAAPDYLESHGTPSVREDLLSHECLLYRSSGGCHGGGGARQCAPSAQPSSTMRIFSSARVLFAPTPLESDAQAIDQSRSSEGLGQEANCSRLQGSGTGGLVGEGGDEYERRAITLGAHHRQEFQSAHARHLQIRDHARGVSQAARLQEVLGGRICLDRVPV
jgi:hypothetical protein